MNDYSYYMYLATPLGTAIQFIGDIEHDAPVSAVDFDTCII